MNSIINISWIIEKSYQNHQINILLKIVSHASKKIGPLSISNILKNTFSETSDHFKYINFLICYLLSIILGYNYRAMILISLCQKIESLDFKESTNNDELIYAYQTYIINHLRHIMSLSLLEFIY